MDECKPPERLSSDAHASGEALFLDHLATIERVVAFACRRNALRDADAEDFGSWAKMKLIENGYEILHKFEGRSFAAYISTVIHRLLLDYRIHAWGKWHASAEARRRGQLGIAIEVMLFRDDRSVEEALPSLRRIQPDVTRDDVERIAACLPRRGGRPRFVELEGVADKLASSGDEVEDVWLTRERTETWRRIASVVDSYLQMTNADDRRMLGLRLGAGLNVAEIARAMNVEQKPLYRRLDRHMTELRKCLQGAGIGWTEARELLDRQPPDLDLSFLQSEGPMPRVDEEQAIGGGDMETSGDLTR